MSSVEIGKALGIPEATVRTRLFRARQMLKEKVTAYDKSVAIVTSDPELRSILRTFHLLSAKV
jgi:hypothetical protein